MQLSLFSAQSALSSAQLSSAWGGRGLLHPHLQVEPEVCRHYCSKRVICLLCCQTTALYSRQRMAYCGMQALLSPGPRPSPGPECGLHLSQDGQVWTHHPMLSLDISVCVWIAPVTLWLFRAHFLNFVSGQIWHFAWWCGQLIKTLVEYVLLIICMAILFSCFLFVMISLMMTGLQKTFICCLTE